MVFSMGRSRVPSPGISSARDWHDHLHSGSPAFLHSGCMGECNEDAHEALALALALPNASRELSKRAPALAHPYANSALARQPITKTKYTHTHMCTHNIVRVCVCVRGTNHKPVDSLCTIRGPTTRRTRHGNGHGRGEGRGTRTRRGAGRGT